MALINTKTHGLLDYAVGAAITALPQFLDCGKPAARVLELAGVGAGIYSMLTNYERGVVKVLPMKAHLTLDALSGGALIAASALLKDEPAHVRATIAGIGAFEIAAALMSETEPFDERDTPSAAERLFEYVT